MSLIEQPLFVDLFERPPFGLDIIVVIGDVRVIHIDPVSDAVRHLLPFALVFPNRLLALTDKRLDTVLLDILLSVHAQRLFHFKLDGQPVRIPTGFPQYMPALHGLIARDNVLHDAR